MRIAIALLCSVLLQSIWQHSASATDRSRYIAFKKFVPEKDPWLAKRSAPPALIRQMGDYYQAIKANGEVTFYYGLGIDHYHSDAHLFFHMKLKDQFAKDGLTVEEMRWEDRDTLTFRHKNIKYVIRLGNERNEFADSFSKYEVVMYGGHSRYGVGAAFQTYDGYFRMGYDFPTIEVDTRTPYFEKEQIRDVAKYPVQNVTLPTGVDEYQYRGVKDIYSKMPSTSYTIRIEGNGRDLRDTTFLPGKQLFLLKSCSNVHYWKKPLREKIPSIDEKLFFGTNEDTHGKQDAFIVFIAAIVKESPKSTDIISAMNATQECGTNCFTAY